MAIRKVAQLGSPVLRKRAEPIPVEEISSEPVQRLIEDMIETNEEYNGAGLAAPQVHESVQLCIIGSGPGPRYPDAEETGLTILINPKITEFSNEMDEDWEGCLSVADLWGKVKRSTSVTVEAYNRLGEKVVIKADNFMARVFQHEIDHLYGKVFLDRMSDMSTLAFAKEFAKYARSEEDEEFEKNEDEENQ